MKILMILSLVSVLAVPSKSSAFIPNVLPTMQTACAYVHANRLKKSLPRASSDKYKHCSLSCHLSLLCGTTGTATIGIIKELVDVIGPGNAEWNDLRANFRGMSLSRRVSGPSGCYRGCGLYYDSGENSLY